MSDAVKLKPSNKSAILGAIDSYNLTQDPYKQKAVEIASAGDQYKHFLSNTIFFIFNIKYLLFNYLLFDI